MKSSLYMRLFLLCIAGLLFALAVFEYRRSKEKEELQKQKALIFKNGEPKDITKLSLTKQDGSRLILEKKEGRWKLIQPVNDLADPSVVEGLIEDLFDESAQSLLEKNVKWSDYDLDPPFANLSLHSTGRRWTIGIGGEPSFDGKFYIKKDQKLFIGSSKWDHLSRPWTNSYRSKALYSQKGGFEKLSYRKSKESYEFIQKDGKWQWSLKESLSQKAVEDLIDLLKGNMISHFSNKKKQPFLNPDLEITIFREAGKDPWTLKIQKTTERKVQAIVSDRDFIYELHQAEPLLTMDFKEKESSEDQSQEEPLTEVK